ncbi:hypothetical protein SGFS_008100 [Streptomyces graminofaciens]|uniref:Uncharacterized protein n=1 Tax=Streptomyces graminofaciens TaxID=68212 RepID=A0ABN5V8B2_9ACTN|nr:hypothetical protein SGFS_008100 [Streptomyces graminofaciens]
MYGSMAGLRAGVGGVVESGRGKLSARRDERGVGSREARVRGVRRLRLRLRLRQGQGCGPHQPRPRAYSWELMLRPPSTSRFCPVTKEASSEAR